MKNNHLLMFNIKEVHNYLRGLMKYNIYDKCTMEWFSRNTLKGVSLEELYEMKKTVERDTNDSSRSNATFWSSISVVMALFIGNFGILLSLNSILKIEYSFSVIFLLLILFAILFLILVAICLERYVNHKRSKLSVLLIILIYLKENEQN